MRQFAKRQGVWAGSNIDGRVAQNTTDIGVIDGRVTNVEGSVTNITNQLNSGTVGLVQQASAGANLTVGKDTDGAAVDFAGTAGARKLVNVAAGDVSAASKEAVNGSQLYTTNQAVAQNASDIAGLDGRVTTAEGNITSLDNRVTTNEGDISTLKTDVTNIDGRVTTNEGDISTLKTDVTNIDGRVTTAEGNISTLTTNVSNIDGRVTNVEGSVSNITNQLNNGEIGLVQYDDAAGTVTVAKDKAGTAVDFRGTAGARRLKGVAAGGEDEDAVNVSQLKKVHNVADGVADHDAVNVSQLNTRLQQNSTEVLVQANSYTDQQIGDVWSGMDKLATQMAKQDSRISQQGAMSMAEAQMASGAAAAAVGNPNGAWSVGLGSEQGHGAISAGYAKPIGEKSQISFGAAFSGNDQSIGVGFAHRL